MKSVKRLVQERMSVHSISNEIDSVLWNKARKVITHSVYPSTLKIPILGELHDIYKIFQKQ
mgnify:FL=1